MKEFKKYKVLSKLDGGWNWIYNGQYFFKAIGVISFLSFFKKFIYLFLERGREGERGEKHECVVASWVPPTGDLALNPGTCPDWKSNQWPFGSQAGTQSTEPHQPALISFEMMVSRKEWPEEAVLIRREGRTDRSIWQEQRGKSFGHSFLLAAHLLSSYH